jgi:polyphenol oxidase
MTPKLPALGLLLVCLAAPAFAQGTNCPRNIPVGNCAPKSGTPTNFAGDTGPMRTRKSIYALSSAEIAELRLAFQRLRALPASDPRSWMAQANVHCWYCAGDSSTVADIHGTWAFMPWHRDYLYMLEKILGQLVNNPNFALPYWDWSTPNTAGCSANHLQMPPVYVPQTVGTTTNSLWDCYRKATGSSTMSASSVVSATANILNTANTFSLFFGGPNTAAALWPGPHGYVHLFVGNLATGTPRPDMGVLETASRDPLFWAHHANIDRLWDVWITKYGTPSYPSGFTSQSWTFWNQASPSKLMRITAGDAANRASRLHYQYAAPACSPSARRVIEELQQTEEAPQVTIGATPQTVTAEAQAAPRQFKIAGSSGEHVVLHLDDVTVPEDQGAILRVWVNKPDATPAMNEEDEHMVRELFIVPSRTPGSAHHAGHQHKFNLAIPLAPSVAAEVESANGQVPVTIVPVSASPEGRMNVAPTEAAPVQMKKPYFRVE